MFWVNVKRIMRSGLASTWRNTFVSLSAVLVMFITLIVISFVIFVGAILNSSLSELESKVDINVSFVNNVPESEIFGVQTALEQLPEVASVEYISSEKVLENFEKRHEDDQYIIQGLVELDENPLGATLNIRAKETSQYQSIATFLENDVVLSGSSTSASIIDDVNFKDNKLAIDRMAHVIDAAETLGLTITAVLAVVSVIITFNTIRLVIYTAREEISVMRLVGASHSYIRGPFVVSGMIYGFVSAILTLLVLYPLVLSLGSTTESFFGSINVLDYYISNFGELFLVLVLTGVILGGFSSFLAVRKYLEV